ncbi:MAG: hypothetical protein WAW17_15860 [Rhodococcus sp. (in: high G+C Gram-positive bacteria)]|uniref:AMIN-like domain-containing (lipo)protein n=1 Tax=Rhodococcus sp. TaxID=1831 RepID=UPI003BAFAD65
MTDVHVEKHDTFDRVIYAFGGHGMPTWKVEYVAEAVEHGTSDTIDLPARSILQADFSGTADTPDATVVAYRPTDPLIESDSDVVSAVYFTPSSSGITQSFIGVRGDRAPFAVTTLSDPPRLVVDIVGS